jgi:hypothetical protein
MRRTQGHSAAGGIRESKNPVTSVFEPATFWLVALCLNPLRYSVTLNFPIIVILIYSYFATVCIPGSDQFLSETDIRL